MSIDQIAKFCENKAVPFCNVVLTVSAFWLLYDNHQLRQTLNSKAACPGPIPTEPTLPSDNTIPFPINSLVIANVGTDQKPEWVAGQVTGYKPLFSTTCESGKIVTHPAITVELENGRIVDLSSTRGLSSMVKAVNSGNGPSNKTLPKNSSPQIQTPSLYGA